VVPPGIGLVVDRCPVKFFEKLLSTGIFVRYSRKSLKANKRSSHYMTACPKSVVAL
jgi:hypothetical protein